jgi:hypothetical protein
VASANKVNSAASLLEKRNFEFMIMLKPLGTTAADDGPSRDQRGMNTAAFAGYLALSSFRAELRRLFCWRLRESEPSVPSK